MKSNSTGSPIARAMSAINTNVPFNTPTSSTAAGVVGGYLFAHQGDLGLDVVLGEQDHLLDVRVDRPARSRSV